MRRLGASRGAGYRCDMAEAIEFAKLSGSGNDFVCIDNRGGRFEDIVSSPERVGLFARTVCRRGLGVGADGVIFACDCGEKGAADIGARFFEPDGSEAELCGNGLASFVHWAVESGWLPDREISICTCTGAARGMKRKDGYVRVCIPAPTDLQTDVRIEVKRRPWTCDYLVTGVPHAVAYVQDVNKVDVAHWGPGIRHHERFQPRGANANFVQVLGEGRIAVRTFEFGVEGETMACGTGSAASAILAARRYRWPKRFASGADPVIVRAHSGDELRVYFKLLESGAATDVCIESLVRFLYWGKMHSQLVERAEGRPNVQHRPEQPQSVGRAAEGAGPRRARE